MLRDYFPLLLHIGVAIGFAVSALLVSVLLGKSGRRTRVKDTAYECGMVPQGEAQPRFSVKFYLVAMLFILFDLEIVFMYPWAVVYKEMVVESKLILWSMLSFITILMVGYVYALKKGALDWKKYVPASITREPPESWRKCWFPAFLPAALRLNLSAHGASHRLIQAQARG